MKRKFRLRSLYHLAQMHKKALGVKSLPIVFSRAVELMATIGIHPNIFTDVQPVRRVTFCSAMTETPFKGVYYGGFNGRKDPHFPEDDIDWAKYGWDGGRTCMIYPTIEPHLWVVLHEFGHYVDDMYFCKD